MFWWTVVGTLTSVVGLGVGIYVLIAAKGAKAAAKETLALAKQRNLVEQLEDTSERIQQMGIFAKVRQSDVLHLRANEVLSRCNEIAMRWPEHLGNDAKNDVVKARAQVRSIANVTFQASSGPLSDRQWTRISGAQLEANGLISGVLGRARKRAEGGVAEND